MPGPVNAVFYAMLAIGVVAAYKYIFAVTDQQKASAKRWGVTYLACVILIEIAWFATK